MSPDRLADYLRHMRQAATLACSYTEGMQKAAFIADKRTQQAVILNIIVIGEAASRVLGEYPDFAARHPAIPWRGIKGMRNRLAHGYFDINLDIVWETVRSALPQLLSHLPGDAGAAADRP